MCVERLFLHGITVKLIRIRLFVHVRDEQVALHGRAY